MPENMLLYAPGPGFDPIRSTFSLFVADYMQQLGVDIVCLLYTSPSPRDYGTSRMPSSA